MSLDETVIVCFTLSRMISLKLESVSVGMVFKKYFKTDRGFVIMAVFFFQSFCCIHTLCHSMKGIHILVHFASNHYKVMQSAAKCPVKYSACFTPHAKFCQKHHTSAVSMPCVLYYKQEQETLYNCLP